MKTSDRIGYNFNIYIQRKNGTNKIRLYKKDSSKDHTVLVVNLPKDMAQGDYVFELTSRKDVFRYTSNSIYVKNPHKVSRQAPPAPRPSGDVYQGFVDASVDTGSGNPLKNPLVKEAVLLIVRNSELERAKRLMKETGWPDGFSFHVSKRRFTEIGGTLQDLKRFQRRLRVFRVRIIQAP